MEESGNSATSTLMWWDQPSSTAASGLTNLEKFIDSVTLSPPSRSLSLGCSRDLNNSCQPASKNVVEWFTLGDLWNIFIEKSAFGHGSPLILDSGKEVKQYYVPYLSAIQIYINNKPVLTTRIGEFESDSCSEESGSDKLSRSLSEDSSKAWDASSSESSLDQDGSCPQTNRLGQLAFQFIEIEPPCSRPPLYLKVIELAEKYPALMTLRSVDLSPASWISVAWYPICHVPTVTLENDFGTCFLSFHTLSSSFQDIVAEHPTGITFSAEASKAIEGKQKESTGTVALPPFGLTTYKMQNDVWIKPEKSDQEKLTNLHSAADSWLKQLSVSHHDFNFFTSHSGM